MEKSTTKKSNATKPKKTVQAIAQPVKNETKCQEYKSSIGKVTEYANALYQNAGVGMQSISDIISSVKCQHLREELQNEYVEFRKIRERVKDFAHESQFKLKNNTFFEKARMWMSIKCSTLFNKSTRHIAEMMILGTIMGLNEVYKNQHDYKCTNRQLDDIADELELLLERNYSNLKTLLKGEHEIKKNKN